MAAVGARTVARAGASVLLWLARTLPACLLATATFAPTTADGAGKPHEATERQIKAAYVSKFASYVDWPPQAFPDSDAPLHIGVLGDEAMAGDIAQLVAGRTIQGRVVRVHALRRADALQGLHILFISRAAGRQLEEALAAARDRPLLTVTETEDGLAQGSIINFVLADGRVRFEVSQKAAQPNHLHISARLLAAATRVIVGPS